MLAQGLTQVVGWIPRISENGRGCGNLRRVILQSRNPVPTILQCCRAQEISELWAFVSKSAIWQTLFQNMIGATCREEEPGEADTQAKMEAKPEPQTPPRQKRPFSMFIDLSSPCAVQKPAAPKRIGECQPASVFQKPMAEAPLLRAPPSKRPRDTTETLDKRGLETQEQTAKEEEPGDVVELAVCEVNDGGLERKYRRTCKKRVKSEAEKNLAILKQHLGKIGAGYAEWQRIHRKKLGWPVESDRRAK